MTLGIALVAIFVLYLVDKHNRWRAAFKIITGLVLLCVLGFGVMYGWSTYTDYRATHPRKPAFDANTPYSSLPSLVPLHAGVDLKPAWIYVDVFQQLGGSLVTLPKIPPQIVAMLNKTEDCVPGSMT